MQLTVVAFGLLFFVVAATGAAIGSAGDGNGLLQSKNVIDVPKKCKPNEQLDTSGNCRPVWSDNVDDDVVILTELMDNALESLMNENADTKNVIDVPKQCKPNEQLDSNGRCRPVWNMSAAKNAELKQKLRRYLQCMRQQLASNISLDCNQVINPSNVIDVPKRCPVGQMLDGGGRCRPIYA